MNISDRYRYLYFVIPKCGSATVRFALRPFTDIGVPVSALAEHVTIGKFLAFYAEAYRFDSYFKFTFVRNPYDRLYSGFRQDMLASRTWSPWIERKAPLFAQVGTDFNRYMNEFVAGADIRDAWDWICFCPMTEFSHRDGRYALDWYGRLENLEADLHTLAGKLGFTLGEIGQFNRRALGAGKEAAEGDYLRFYTAETVRFVNETYAEDFDFFGYAMVDPGDFPDVLPATESS